MRDGEDDDVGVDSEGDVDYNKKRRRDPLINDVFPQENIARSDTSRWAIIWAHKSSTKTGDQALASYHGRWYLIQRFDDAEQGYRILSRIYQSEYRKIFEEVEQYGRSGKIQTIKGCFDRVDLVDRSSNPAVGTGSSADPVEAGYVREDPSVPPLGADEIGTERGEQLSSDEGRNRESGGLDRSGRDTRIIEAGDYGKVSDADGDKTYFPSKQQTSDDPARASRELTMANLRAMVNEKGAVS